MLCFLRADREPTPRRLAAFAASAALALTSHYFAVFLLAPMCLWLLRRRERRRATLPAVAAVGTVGLALAPLALAQGGHGTQWIGEWPLAERLAAIPQYYLTGYSGAPLGHGVELLVALAILAGVGFGLWRTLTPRESDGALLALAITACGVLIPVAMAAAGADYLAPRNVVAAMIPVTATIAVIVAARRTGRTGMVLAGVIALAFLAISRRRRPLLRACSAGTGAAWRRRCPRRGVEGRAGRRSARPGRAVARQSPAESRRARSRGGGPPVRSRPSSSGRRRWSTTCPRCTTSRAARR